MQNFNKINELWHNVLGKFSKLSRNKECSAPQEDAEMTENARRIYYTKISNYLFYILAFILAYQGASLFWNSIPYKNKVIAGLTRTELAQIRAPKNQTSSSVSTLFGIETQPQVVENKPQPQQPKNNEPRKSSLGITITGISASTDPNKGSVALIYSGKEDTYGVGEVIAKTNAKISQILPDRIIIINNGMNEVVMLPGEDFKPVSRNNDNENVKTPEKKEQLQQVRTELLSNPGSLFNYLSIKPAIRDGKTIGYELNPGKEEKLFIDAGLRAGDIAVEINGRDLTNNAEAMAAMGELQQATSISLVVDRNGSRETINLDLQ